MSLVNDHVNDDISDNAGAAPTLGGEVVTTATNVQNISNKTFDALTIAGVSAAAFPGITTPVANSEIYYPAKDSYTSYWPEMMSNRSWYAALGEPPSKGIAIAEASTIKIFGLIGDVPTLWATLTVNTTISSVKWVGGKLIVGASGGVFVWDFINEVVGRYISTGYYEREFGLDVLGSEFSLVDASRAIVSTTVNDIAVTTLPNAPVVGYGVKTPTVGAFTDGGVSVIRDDGTVVDYTYTGVSASIQATGGSFSDDGGIAWVSRDLGASGFPYLFKYDAIANADVTTAPDLLATNFTNYSGISADIPLLGSGTFEAGCVFKGDSLYVYGQNGLTIIKPNKLTPSSSLYNYIATDHQSGWMKGDVELALSGNSLTDRSVTATVVTDNGAATFAAVNGGDLQATTAVGGTLTAPVTTGGECYGWEKVGGVWTWRPNIASWTGVSEAAGVLTIADGTTFTLLCYTNTPPTTGDLSFIESDEKPQFNSGALNKLGGSSNNIVTVAVNESTGEIEAQSGDTLSTIQGSSIVATEASTNTLIAVDGDTKVKG